MTMGEPKTTNETSLLYSVEEGLINQTKDLLSSNSINLNDRRYFDYHLLIKAIDKHQIDIAKLMIDKGFRVFKKFKPSQERTALHAATQLGDIELIEILLAKGASIDIFSSDEQDQTPFHLAIDLYSVFTTQLFLSQFDLKYFEKRSLLHYAVMKSRVEVMSQLILKGFSLKQKNSENQTPFCTALQKRNFYSLNSLLSFCSVENIDLNSFDDVGPVYIASICGNLQVVKKYVAAGFLINLPLKLSKKSWSAFKNYSGFTLLHFAVLHRRIKLIRYLLRKKVDILDKNKNGSTALHMAFETKEKGYWMTWQNFEDNNLIIDMISKSSVNFKSNPVNKQGLSHFHIACSMNDPTVVDHFLKLGAPINHPVKTKCCFYKGFSPLHFAAKFRCTKTLELLLKNGADVRKTDFHKMTALHLAVKEYCPEIVSLLLEHGADITALDSHGNTPVHSAFEKNYYNIIDLLLSSENATKLNPANSKGLSHFHIACTRNNVNVIKSFIESGVNLDTCIPNSDVTIWSGYSPLHLAVYYRRSKIVQLLLNSGANVEIKDTKGRTPLHIAYKYTYETFEEFIETTLYDLNKRGKVDIKRKRLTDTFAVGEGYSNGCSGSAEKIDWSSNRIEHMKVINLLLNNQSDVDCADNRGNTPVFYAYSSVHGIADIIQNTLNCSEDLWDEIINSLTEELYERRKSMLTNLLKHDVNLDKSFKNSSILHYNCLSSRQEKKDNEMIELFLKKGANVNATDDEMLTPLYNAILLQKDDFTAILLDYHADVNHVNPKDNSTPFLTAALTASKTKFAMRKPTIFKMLVAKGAKVNARLSDGRTALHILASRIWGRFDDIGRILDYLTKAGADINSQDLRGSTPLHVACKARNLDTVEELIRYGADINVEDNEGRSICCYLYAKHCKNLAVEGRGDSPTWILYHLRTYVTKMSVVGLPVSDKVQLSINQFNDSEHVSSQAKAELIEKYKKEVQLLRDAKIHDYCSLYNVIFKTDNALSFLVKNRQFKVLLQAKTFDKKYKIYGYLVKLKYQAGVDRGNLLPAAKFLLTKLTGIHLPDTCSENICKYFTNIELKESIECLRDVLDLKIDKSDDIQLRSRRSSKRQRVN